MMVFWIFYYCIQRY